MKNRHVAFVLSFLLPGAGLAYLGQWNGAAANLGIAFGIAPVKTEHVTGGSLSGLPQNYED